MNKMTVTVFSGVSADGFEINLHTEDNHNINESYYYGYQVSSSREYAERAHEDHVRFGHKDKPFVSDILEDYIKKFGIDEMEVVPGKNVFQGKPMSDDDVTKFKEKYCQTFLTELALSKGDMLSDVDLNGLSQETEPSL